ncbi:hypothetical protein [Paenibacillus sp. IITD108]|uniref:hypothetical protein n=1 Tax=Paenibacillus sp. IITD108 TaxID=3116649 RepID=UPI002F42BB13
MVLSKKKFVLSIMLVIALFFSILNTSFATNTSIHKGEFTITQALIDEFINSITNQELLDNQYLSAVLNDMDDIVKDSEGISISKFKIELYEKESFANHQRANLESSALQTQYILTDEDEEQLKRVDQLALQYYNYFQENGTYPNESNDMIQPASFSDMVRILKEMGLAFTEQGLATRLAALGPVAAVDGPLPVGDFIALVGGAVIVGGFVYSYLSTATAISNNIGINEGVTYKTKATSSLSQSRTIAYPNNYKHFSAAPNTGWGGGVFVLEPIPYSMAVLRAVAELDTYNLSMNDAREVAQQASTAGTQAEHDFAHTHDANGVYKWPYNKPHWHSMKSFNVRAAGHHWYG